jgi:hypothetical protein
MDSKLRLLWKPLITVPSCLRCPIGTGTFEQWIPANSITTVGSFSFSHYKQLWGLNEMMSSWAFSMQFPFKDYFCDVWHFLLLKTQTEPISPKLEPN